MYSTTSDKMNLHGRTGSHATKGSGRGTVWWDAPPAEIDPGTVEEEYARLIAVFHQASLRSDRELKNALLPRIKEMSNLRKAVRRAAAARREAAAAGVDPSQVPSDKQKRAQREMARRRTRGAIPREDYEQNGLSQQRPWEREGISRSTWYRQRRGQSK